MRLEAYWIVTAAASGMGVPGVRLARSAAVGVVDIDEVGVASVVAEIAVGGRAKGIVADLTKDEDAARIVRDIAANTFDGLDLCGTTLVTLVLPLSKA